jgi:hypothetical protein
MKAARQFIAVGYLLVYIAPTFGISNEGNAVFQVENADLVQLSA